MLFSVSDHVMRSLTTKFVIDHHEGNYVPLVGRTDCMLDEDDV